MCVRVSADQYQCGPQCHHLQLRGEHSSSKEHRMGVTAEAAPTSLSVPSVSRFCCEAVRHLGAGTPSTEL